MAALCIFLASAVVPAQFILPDLERIPIARLVTNLERMVGESPKDVGLLINLARVHAMAYAMKTTDANVWRGRERDGVWTGHEPRHTQFAVKTGASAAAEKIAQDHLARAIARYREAMALDPDHAVANLGLGWALIQAGQKNDAIAPLRKAMVSAWIADQKPTVLIFGWRSMTEEAGRYLIPLLDPVRDKVEIEDLKAKVAVLEKRGRAITPIAVPLRDGLTALDIVDAGTSVVFDADGSGVPRRWSWITPDAAWLVYDQQGRGDIGSALQLFGSVSFWLFWDTGYGAMRALDDDADGELQGFELRNLALWHDRNSNGRSDAGEVRGLAEWGVAALSTRFEIDATHPEEIAYSRDGIRFQDGSSRPTYDILLHRNPHASHR
jgi:tetratricopeptide (TPR) repeat protein